MVEVGVEVEVEFEVGFEVGVEVEVKVRAQNYFFRVGGWVGGWLEKWRIKQSSNLKLELGNTHLVVWRQGHAVTACYFSLKSFSIICSMRTILVPNRAFLYESSGQSSSSKSVESVGGVHSQEEMSHWQFNSPNESLAI